MSQDQESDENSPLDVSQANPRKERPSGLKKLPSGDTCTSVHKKSEVGIEILMAP